jgi:hypothetical protein
MASWDNCLDSKQRKRFSDVLTIITLVEEDSRSIVKVTRAWPVKKFIYGCLVVLASRVYSECQGNS